MAEFVRSVDQGKREMYDTLAHVVRRERAEDRMAVERDVSGKILMSTGIILSAIARCFSMPFTCNDLYATYHTSPKHHLSAQ